MTSPPTHPSASDPALPAPDAPADAEMFDVDDALCRYRRSGAELLSLAFDAVVFAGYDSTPKPDPEPFGRALRALSVRPERAIHVGNSLGSDVAGAHAAGVRAAWLADGRTTGAGIDTASASTYTLTSMADLLDPPWRE